MENNKNSIKWRDVAIIKNTTAVPVCEDCDFEGYLQLDKDKMEYLGDDFYEIYDNLKSKYGVNLDEVDVLYALDGLLEKLQSKYNCDEDEIQLVSFAPGEESEDLIYDIKTGKYSYDKSKYNDIIDSIIHMGGSINNVDI